MATFPIVTTGDLVSAADWNSIQDYIGQAFIEKKDVTGLADYTFSVPTRFTGLRLVGGGSHNAAGNARLFVRFNGLAGSNYEYLLKETDAAGTVGIIEDTSAGLILCGKWGTSATNAIAITVPQADSSQPGLTAQAWGRTGTATTDRFLSEAGGHLATGGPVTSITIGVSGTTFDAATFYLYGLG